MATNSITHRLNLAESELGNRYLTFGFIILGFLRTNIKKKKENTKLFSVFLLLRQKKAIFALFLIVYFVLLHRNSINQYSINQNSNYEIWRFMVLVSMLGLPF
jgi:hypothetical protein